MMWDRIEFYMKYVIITCGDIGYILCYINILFRRYCFHKGGHRGLKAYAYCLFVFFVLYDINPPSHLSGLYLSCEQLPQTQVCGWQTPPSSVACCLLAGSKTPLAYDPPSLHSPRLPRGKHAHTKPEWYISTNPLCGHMKKYMTYTQIHHRAVHNVSFFAFVLCSRTSPFCSLIRNKDRWRSKWRAVLNYLNEEVSCPQASPPGHSFHIHRLQVLQGRKRWGGGELLNGRLS